MTGIEEAERQMRVAERLHAASRPALPWARLSLEKRRAWIDRACTPEHRDETD